PTVRLRFQQHAPSEIAIPAIVKAELCYGAYRSASPERNMQLVREFLAPFVCLPFDEQTAEVYGRLRHELASQGTPIGPNDLLIAATALAYKLIVVTNNLAEFERVPELVCRTGAVSS
ncbi:MAG: type II toxin-antitoxin system VapC family toxin, partial [Fimbriimonadales bacterium]|nr:type II toxin-antitoxin system VapC family toxin [Fimbriimonadales bacterium]